MDGERDHQRLGKSVTPKLRRAKTTQYLNCAVPNQRRAKTAQGNYSVEKEGAFGP
jgi:hypothetical protein